VDILTNPSIVLANWTLDSTKISVNLNFIVDVPSPINIVVTVKHFSNGAYVKSFLNVDTELCSFLKTKNQNLVFKQIFDYVRTMGKVGTRCPLKRVRIEHRFV
jgi:Protein of unknown function (DUF1091)